MSTGIQQWIEHEFANVAFGDARLDRRFRAIVVDLAGHCGKTLASSFESWSKIKASYRFFANKRVTLQTMLAPHIQRTAERIRNHSAETVLLLQDTTYFDFGKRKKTDKLDVVGRHGSGTLIKGLMLHNTLACDVEGLPLGLVDQRFIDRKELGVSSGAADEKESGRWADIVDELKILDFGDTRAVHVMDREGDAYAVFRQADAVGAHVLVRAQHNRVIDRDDQDENTGDWLFDKLSAKRAQGRTSVRIQINDKKKYRTATLSIVYMTFEMPPPRDAKPDEDGTVAPALSLTAIMAIERGASNLQDALCWVLITNLPVTSTEEAIEKVQWYARRWNVEVFHKILKSGCAVEKAQLRDAERLKNYIVLKSVVAWRLFWLARLREHDPEGSCEEVLEPLEWTLLYRKIHKTSEVPETPPMIEQALIWIAKLGGYIARPSDPPPGVVSQWRGWERLAEIVDDYRDICGSS